WTRAARIAPEMPLAEMPLATASFSGRAGHANAAATRALTLSGINGDSGIGRVLDSTSASSPDTFISSGGAGGSQSFGTQISPEPTSAALLSAGAAAILLRRRRRRRRRA